MNNILGSTIFVLNLNLQTSLVIMSQNQMFAEFKKLAKKDWLVKAEKELRGKPLAGLSSNWHGLNIEPYYSTEDFVSSESSPIITHRKAWINYVEIEIKGEKEANLLAKRNLNLGATGIIFKLKKSIDFSPLLDGIEPNHCSISFTGKINANEYFNYIDRNHPQAKISGFIDNAVEIINSPYEKFYTSLLKSDSENEVTELADILVACYQILDKVRTEDSKTVISQMAYEVAMSTNYFFGITKIRALRILLSRFYAAYQLSIAPEIFHVIARSKAWKKDDYGPHENILKATTASMAAISGGCNSLVIEPGYHDEQEELVARNISSILEFESYLGKVADPTAGSYFMEHLTHEMVNTVWSEFKSRIES